MKSKIVFLAILTCPLSVSVPEISIFYLISLGILGIVSALSVDTYKPNVRLTRFLGLYLLPFVLSLLVALPLNYFVYKYLNYTELQVFGRALNLIVLSVSIIMMDKMLQKQEITFRNLVNWYFTAVSIMILSALWQAFDFYMGFPNFPFETRSHLHSAAQSYTMEKRLTGLAQEPSYLASYIIDFLIFGIILFKSKLTKISIAVFGIVILFLTFSPSSYISLLAIAALYFTYSKKTVSFYVFGPVLLAFGVLVASLYLNVSNIEGISYFVDRLGNAEDSGRVRVIFKAIDTLFQTENLPVLLFGYGFKSFELLSQKFPNYISVETSNSLLIDALFECGLIGISILVFFFVYLFRNILRIESPKLRLFGLLLFVDLTVSSLYRADYASFRFFLLLYFMFILVNYGNTHRGDVEN